MEVSSTYFFLSLTKTHLYNLSLLLFSGTVWSLTVSWKTVKVKDEVNPRRDHEGPEGEQTYNCTLSLTSALYGDGWSTPRPGRFIPGKDPVHIV
jgi:hypothetical protein